jgi:flagellar biosynthesis/type III secretory pathway protein FliH
MGNTESTNLYRLNTTLDKLGKEMSMATLTHSVSGIYINEASKKGLDEAKNDLSDDIKYIVGQLSVSNILTFYSVILSMGGEGNKVLLCQEVSRIIDNVPLHMLTSLYSILLSFSGGIESSLLLNPELKETRKKQNDKLKQRQQKNEKQIPAAEKLDLKQTYNDGYKKGEKKGLQKGYDTGFNDGLKEKEKEILTKPKDEKLQLVYAEGFKSGECAGEQRAKADSFKDGYNQAIAKEKERFDTLREKMYEEIRQEVYQKAHQEGFEKGKSLRIKELRTMREW